MKKNMDEKDKDKDLDGSALQGHFHSAKAVSPEWPPSQLEVCA